MIVLFMLLCTGFGGAQSVEPNGELVPKSRFNPGKDLLLAHYDFKTDVDDLHSVAALSTLLSDDRYRGLNVHAVAGTYGRQEGEYVPPNPLMLQALGSRWSDAHADWQGALNEVLPLVLDALDDKGAVWIAEGGQSDFSADLIRLVRELRPGLETASRIHIVQHADWNEEVTSDLALEYVRVHGDYQRIPDGNARGNGTPGFRSDRAYDLNAYFENPDVRATWKLARELAVDYNGIQGRYFNSDIAAGGLDFSDFAEVCWILELEHLEDANAYFRYVVSGE